MCGSCFLMRTGTVEDSLVFSDSLLVLLADKTLHMILQVDAGKQLQESGQSAVADLICPQGLLPGAAGIQRIKPTARHCRGEELIYGST